MRNLAAVLSLGAATALGSQTALGYRTLMIRDTGPANNRVNIVILGDGYLESELPQLEADVRTAVGNIAAEPFYAEYATFINVKLVLTTSTSNVIGSGSPGATLFGLYFGCQGIDRLICIGDYGRVADVLNQDAPEWDLVAVIANSPNYGGSGGQFVTFTRDATSTELFIHETAHQFATLADEYPDAYPSYPLCASECPEANVTPTAAPWQNLKWNYWVNPATPLPTPDTAQYANSVGAFEGARYQTTGLYRPRHTCRMRAPDQTFCEVCTEAHVLETYRLVAEFDTITPNTTQFSLPSNTATSLSVTHPQTLRNSVQYVWQVDGASVGDTSSSITLPANSLSAGDHTVSVQLSDTTSFAGRDDPLLHKQHTWQLKVTAASGTGGSAGTGGATGSSNVGGNSGSATTGSATTGSAAAGGALVGSGGATSAGGTQGPNGGTLGTTAAPPGVGGSPAPTGGYTSSAGGTAAGASTSDVNTGGLSGTGGASTLAPTSSAGGSTTSSTTGIQTGTAGDSPPAADAGNNISCTCSIPGPTKHPAYAFGWVAITTLLLRRCQRVRRRSPNARRQASKQH